MPTVSPPVSLWNNPPPGLLPEDPEPNPQLTLYLPDGEGPFSCIAVCPGGGYSGRAAHEGVPIAEWLTGIGVAAAVVEYRVAPHRHPIPHDDAARAISLLRSMAADWNLNPGKIGILGFSAGGHCATSVATIFDEGDASASDPVCRQSSRPDALVACYPVITFGEKRHNGSMVNLLADASGAVSPEMQEYLSLEKRVTPATPPTFLWHTANDAAVPVANSLLFAEACARNEVPFALHVFPDGRHGLGLADNHPAGSWTTLCARWLNDLGF